MIIERRAGEDGEDKPTEWYGGSGPAWPITQTATAAPEDFAATIIAEIRTETIARLSVSPVRQEASRGKRPGVYVSPSGSSSPGGEASVQVRSRRSRKKHEKK